MMITCDCECCKLGEENTKIAIGFVKEIRALEDKMELIESICRSRASSCDANDISIYTGFIDLIRSSIEDLKKEANE